MPTEYWIKFYIEVLDDPKMATLPDRLWRRFYELCLIAGRQRDGGNIPDATQIAWALRMPERELMPDLNSLAEKGLLKQTEKGWIVVNFAKRQAPMEPAEKMRIYRTRTKKEQYYNDQVTNDVTNVLRKVTDNVTEMLPNALQITDNRSDNRTDTTTGGAAFTKFQNEISLLTPRTSEIIGGWVDDYSEPWTIDAIDEAVKNNVRKPAYIDAILKRWKAEGRNNGKSATKFVPEDHATEVYG